IYRGGTLAGQKPCLPGSGDAEGVERGSDGLAEGAGEAVGGLALLLEDPLGRLRALLVTGQPCYPLQLLVDADLEVLERAYEGGELARCVRLPAEERGPVESAEPQRRVLERRRVAAERVEALLDQLRVISGLGEMVLVDVREAPAPGELLPALEQLDRLRL